MSFYSSQTLYYMNPPNKRDNMTTKTTRPHWDYMDRLMHPTMDFTNLDRLPTDTVNPALNALNARINARNEEIEDMFSGVESMETECSDNQLAIQNNVVTIQSVDTGKDNKYDPGF